MAGNIFFDSKITYKSDDFNDNKDCQRHQIRAQNISTNNFTFSSYVSKKIPFAASNLAYNQDAWALVGVDRATAKFISIYIENPDPTQFGVNNLFIGFRISDAGNVSNVDFGAVSFTTLNASATEPLPNITLRSITVLTDQNAVLTIIAG